MTQRIEIAAVIFDLGNVVLDWDVDRILGSIGVSEPEQKLLRTELFGHQDWVDMDHGKKSQSTVLADVCARTTLPKETVECALLAAKTSLDTIPATIDLMKLIKERGIPIYCLSNMSVETYHFIRNRSFFDMFSGVVISGVEKCLKPDKKIFELPLRRFKLEADSTLFVDDSLKNIESARAIGMKTVHFDRTEECYSHIRTFLS